MLPPLDWWLRHLEKPYSPCFLCNQSRRTQPARQFLYNQIPRVKGLLTLDVGCGTGVITPELATYTSHATAIGIDIDSTILAKAINRNKSTNLHFLLADATALPFRANLFTFALSHFTLMWIPKRMKALSETFRILCSKGILAAIEPDYSGRIEARNSSPKQGLPPQSSLIKCLQNLGADPFSGSQLPADLSIVGFTNTRFGVLSWEFNKIGAHKEILGEAALLKTQGIQWDLPTFTFTPIFWVLASKP